ncbi:MAG: divergent polysaccharide deacetylase family protein [Elusimicrobia bacterium]|nr:divergent polysaccharide deacetylase family protein [Elusimicrobiota bacterium]
MNKLLAAVLLLASPSAFAAAPQVAIVIDDFGLNYKKTPPDEEWMALPGEMTFAVMPESPRTKKVSPLVSAAPSKELMIHYPFDPFQSLKLAKDAVDPEDALKVAALLDKAMKQIPNAKGLNNHRSYKATRNRPLMNAFMAQLKSTGLYFLDSKVSEKSVAHAEAAAAGIPAASNNVFLDTAELHTQPFCAKMLRQAVSIARKKGSAIAIGHHYFRTTFDCLKEEMPKHEKDGVVFVKASALAR